MKCDFHVHTHYSYDSTASAREMVEAALKKGIDCLVIADHQEIKGAFEAIDYSQGKPLLIIPGVEVKSKDGDILALNVKTIIPAKLSAGETIKKIKEAGGTVIIPHPFASLCRFKANLEDLISQIDGIEVLNASAFGKGNRKAWDFAQKNNLPFTAGSDAHFPNLVGRVYLEIPGQNLSVEEVLAAIKEKKGKLGGKEADFFEKIIDHLKRNIAKVF